MNSNKQEYEKLLKKTLYGNNKNKSSSEAIFNNEVQVKKFMYFKAIYRLD